MISRRSSYKIARSTLGTIQGQVEFQIDTARKLVTSKPQKWRKIGARKADYVRLRAGKYPVRVGCKKHDASLRQSHIRGQPRGNRKLTLTSSPCHTYFVAAAVFMVWLVSDFERERERERESVAWWHGT